MNTNEPGQIHRTAAIDVVVPCYRYGHYLRECVRSVLDQQGANIRVLVIDDASPDETALVGAVLAAEDSRVTFRRHAVNQGHIATYNEGIEWARADCMLLLSADDYLLPGALRHALGLMARCPDVGLCFGEALVRNSDGTTTLMRVPVPTGDAGEVVLPGEDIIRLFVSEGAHNFVPTPTAFVRTALLHRLGGYSAELPHAGDFELWLRLAAHAPVGFVKMPLAVYRRHADNMSLDFFRDHQLTDLQQRKAAFDVFLCRCEGATPKVAALYQDLLKRLGTQAVRNASGAFNDRQFELSYQLSNFGVSVYPPVRFRMAWFLIFTKRLLGFRMSSALAPAVRKLRSTVAQILGGPRLPTPIRQRAPTTGHGERQ